VIRLLLLVGAVAAGGCSPPRLAHAEPSSEALARAVLQALQSRDHAQLSALAVSEEEFEHRVWVGLPAARPERNMPWSYVWMDLRQKSDATLARTLAEHGGRRYQLESVRFAGETTDHGSYRIHRETVLVVRGGEGTVSELRLLGAMIEADGRWKVFSYVVDS
jgi:hypothetical protein